MRLYHHALAACLTTMAAASPAVAPAGERRSTPKVAQPRLAAINRWTGKPHEDRREIARRLRQQAQREAKRAGRAA